MGGDTKVENEPKLSKKQKQKQLQQIYLNSNKRYFEYLTLFLYSMTWPIAFYQYIIQPSVGSPLACALSFGFFLIAMVISDVITGLMHWGFDTWGTIETPVFGAFIRSFREHHLDAAEMCNHDFVETNADSALGSVPVLFYFVFVAPTSTIGWGFYSILIWTSLLTTLTNEFHKWSHLRKRNAIVAFLQDWHIILPPRHHHVHHTSPHDEYYCITNGWMNPVLEKVNFWKNLETAITKLTGAIPREDDFSWCDIPASKAHK
mmetsp:Transcript_38457/g.53561  ORF Transcript_38457/g.53561 Transcript_38457/m.53561 type:complete len:261 (+) Transcript_38457:240-1022(+)|eukprot:CAMPEP_0201482010 /NCGR_PEP_ID=MMETSP0151_2-20130828/6261_1 /ASSEMBLY_ACC=CAM_ASM_000257 /TAXON_ID=200890 /ORGANISM="Paramoeba atlantica, Strain 621/1 / CCAP 1560/9" /LENGTH=260 /DNA_ID=CAMNT_0047864465 /DNA_START=68 /DNA_END=850 /DNA_ORIENTATION=+